MKRLMFLMCLFAMMAASTSVKAQEVAIELVPGWNWIAYPYAETVDLNTALGSFTPTVGDMIKSQFGSSSYLFGRWRGAIQSLNAGEGYHYFSNRTEPVTLVFGLPSIPMGTLTVTTSEPTNITSTTATCGGSAVSNDGTSILMKGVCWATHPQPTTNDSYTEDGNGPGDFTSEISELDPETVYYVRAYAVSVKGINYGEELSFTTSSPGILNGVFSVSENNQVYFSQGNLQYRASTNTWRFAEHQWDFVGESNANASPTYDGWIDLFAWATSGYDHAMGGYQPWSEGCNAYDGELLNLCDRTGKADWGYNAISNGGNEERLWRTCTDSEWGYLMFDRQTVSGIRFAKATIGEINGIILLPDNWDATLYSLNNVNEGEASYDGNVILLEVWMSVFEANGAVFLPASGRIQDWAENDYNQCGMYWNSSSHYVGYLKGLLSFGGDGMGLGYYYTDEQYSVRLVRAPANASYAIEAVSNPANAGTVEGSGIYDYYTAASLTAIPNEGYTFICWKENGRIVSTDNTYEILALFDRNLEATFYETSTYPLTYSFNEDDHTATVTGHWEGVELTGEIVIPETVMHNGESYTVTSVGEYALSDCSGLTSIVFSNSLVSIGNWAFRYCNGLTEVIIPSSVTSIGVNPFANCSNLAQITVESGNAYYDSRDNCNAIIETGTNILVSGSLNTIIPNTVTRLGQDAFNEILVSSITFPASVNYIGVGAIMNIPTLSTITVLAEVPPTLGGCAFCDTDHSIPVYVPCASIEAYQNAEGWSGFTNFIGVGQCSGMVTVTASPAEYGTVSGGGFYEGGETCTVTATPNEGYYFLCWMEDGQWVSSQATYTFPVYRDRNLTAVFTIGAELVVNGDFEQGNVGFISEYNYNYDIGQGDYYVDDNPHGWEGFGHGGSGNFMLIDAATEPGINVWTEQISVVPNTYYAFSAWVCTLYPESMALLQFSINGTQVGDVFTAPSQTNTWEQFNALWYSGNSTTATITILDQNTEGSGNDFGLDDISFRAMDPVQGEIPEGAINGKFTINEDGDQVYFSQGNLQYQASTDTWKFAENQWDYVGYDNNFSQTNTGWIDLFAWGTSGYNHGAVNYQPWSYSTCSVCHYAYGNSSYNLSDSTGMADWGYNAISNGGNTENSGWRTLSDGEWNYVLFTRTTTSGLRYAKAQVNEINGLILLPDNWTTSTFTLNDTNNSNASFSSNTITALQWSTLEQVGAVFLPAAGMRNGSLVTIGTQGLYWSSSPHYDSHANEMAFNEGYLGPDYIWRFISLSVRLVAPAEN